MKKLLTGQMDMILENDKLDLFSYCSVKLADCLIVSQIPNGAALCTFDQEFKKIKKVNSYSPQEILKTP